MASCVIRDVTDDADPASIDEALSSLLLSHKGNVSDFLITVFTFLQRKSNFFKTDEPKKRVLEALRSATGEQQPFKAGFLGSRPSTSKGEKHAISSAVQKKTENNIDPRGPSGFQPPADDHADKSETIDAKDNEMEGASKGLKPTEGRGAVFDHYSWSQTLGECTVLVPVAAGTKGRNLDVQIQKDYLKVGLKGQPAILDGRLSEAIKTEECVWNLADNIVEITLQKAEGMHWWKNVLVGEPEIDTQKVEPENSNLKDLDPDTRQTVEKMMFDQRQKALGLPTSDDLQKQEILKKFMAAHPEMDFSNAKMM